MKKIIKNLIPCLLVFSLLIGSCFCYLSSVKKDKKVINIGKVSVEINDSWYNDDDEQVISYEDVTADDVLDKEISVENTGDHGAWVFAVIGTPYINRIESQALADTAENDIKVKAIAVQDNFKGFDDVSKVWSYFGNAGSMLGESVSVVSYNVANLFEFGNGSAWNKCGASWIQVDTFRTDGWYWYIYGYKTVLAAGDETDPVITQVRLNQKLGKYDTLPLTQTVCIGIDDACEMLRTGTLYGFTSSQLLNAKLYYYYNNSAISAASYQTLGKVLIKNTDGTNNDAYVYNFSTVVSGPDGSVNTAFSNVKSSVTGSDGSVTYTVKSDHSYKLFLEITYRTDTISKGADVSSDILNNSTVYTNLPYQVLSEDFSVSDSTIDSKTDKDSINTFAAKLTSLCSTDKLNPKLHSNATLNSYKLYIIAAL